MGYSTDFDGAITIEPPLTPRQVNDINAFCGERHGNNKFHDGFPGFYCDWEVADDGTEIGWNGSEKSYCMPEWLAYLIANFMEGHTLNGTMEAAGEDPNDRWYLCVKQNRVYTEDAVIMPSGNITEIEPAATTEAIALPDHSGLLTVNPQGLAEYIAGFVKDLGGDAPEEAVRIFRSVFPDLPITVNDNGTFTIDTEA